MSAAQGPGWAIDDNPTLPGLRGVAEAVEAGLGDRVAWHYLLGECLGQWRHATLMLTIHTARRPATTARQLANLPGQMRLGV